MLFTVTYLKPVLVSSFDRITSKSITEVVNLLDSADMVGFPALTEMYECIDQNISSIIQILIFYIYFTFNFHK